MKGEGIDTICLLREAIAAAITSGEDTVPGLTLA
jgi:hypothetical protein